jgi:hypothetical protein
VRAGALLLAWCAACGARSRPAEKPPRPEATPAQWEEAWDLVTEFGEPKADLGPWRVENAGAIIVSRVGPQPGAVSDLELQSRLETVLAEAKVQVEVRAGVVHLHGGLPSRKDAGNAIWAIPGVRGIDQIVSYLTWPGSEMKPLKPRRHAD